MLQVSGSPGRSQVEQAHALAAGQEPGGQLLPGVVHGRVDLVQVAGAGAAWHHQHLHLHQASRHAQHAAVTAATHPAATVGGVVACQDLAAPQDAASVVPPSPAAPAGVAADGGAQQGLAQQGSPHVALLVSLLHETCSP